MGVAHAFFLWQQGKQMGFFFIGWLLFPHDHHLLLNQCAQESANPYGRKKGLLLPCTNG